MKAAEKKAAERRPAAPAPRIARVQAIESSPAPRIGLRDSLRRMFGRGAGRPGDEDWLALGREEVPDARAESFGSLMAPDIEDAPPLSDSTSRKIDAPGREREAPRPPAAAYLQAEVDEASAEEMATHLMALLEHLVRFSQEPEVARRGRWSVLTKVPVAGIAQTRVRMELSPTEIQIRFETEDRGSRTLLHHCVAAFERALQGVVLDARPIEVRLW